MGASRYALKFHSYASLCMEFGHCIRLLVSMFDPAVTLILVLFVRIHILFLQTLHAATAWLVLGWR